MTARLTRLAKVSATSMRSPQSNFSPGNHVTAEIQQVVTATQQNVQDAASSIADVKDEMASLSASVAGLFC